MKMNKKSAKRLPLSGVRVLVGRARHQAGKLSSELRSRGATVTEIPFIEIRKPKSFKPLDEALKNIFTYDWLILTSVNGVEAMWERVERLKLNADLKERDSSRAVKRNATDGDSSAGVRLRIAAIGPATKRAIEQHGARVDVVPKEYVAESVVRSLRRRVKGKRVLLVRAKIARDVIPTELRKAGAHVDVVEAYETVVPKSSRARLRQSFQKVSRCPHVITFTSSSTVRNFVTLMGNPRKRLGEIKLASIGPVTESTLRELGLRADISAEEYTITGLVAAILLKFDKVGK